MCKISVVYFWFFAFYPPVKAKVPLLTFPPTAPTRTQWICGIGIPLENLKFEAMTTGFVLKAEYFLPDNVTNLKTKSVLPLDSRKFVNSIKLDTFDNAPLEIPQKTREDLLSKKAIVSSYRWTVYKGLEGLANRLGLSGRDCVLKSICEAVETPFNYFNGLFSELLYILLAPSSSADKVSTHSDNEYYYAEHLGHSGASCQRVFNHCPRSLLDYISDIHNLSEGAKKLKIF